MGESGAAPLLFTILCNPRSCIPSGFRQTGTRVTLISSRPAQISVSSVLFRKPLGDFVQQIQMSRSAGSDPAQGLPFAVKITCMLNQVWVSQNKEKTSSQELASGPVFWSIRELEVSGRVVLLRSFIHKALWSPSVWTMKPLAMAAEFLWLLCTFVLQTASHLCLTPGLEGYSLR